MSLEKQNKELLAACEAALRRINQLNTGTEKELGPDPTAVQLEKAIRNAKKKSVKKRASSASRVRRSAP